MASAFKDKWGASPADAILNPTAFTPSRSPVLPTYEYACTSCGRRFEVVQRFSEEPLQTCEVCGGELRRVFHPVGVLFKGSGFYSTDSRTGMSKSESTDDSKSDSKPRSPGEKPPSKEKSSTEAKPDSSTTSSTQEKSSPATQGKKSGDKSGG